MRDLFQKLSDSHPKLSRGLVWCATCGREMEVVSSWRMQHGWPECCGETMTIDSPAEREPEQLETRKEGDDGRE